MTQRVLRVLEYNKILQILSEMAVSTPGKERIAAMVPSSDYEEVRQMQAETDEAVVLSLKKGAAPVPAVSRVKEAVKRAVLGGSLSLKELLAVGGVLRGAAAVQRYLAEMEETAPILCALGKALVAVRPLEKQISDSILSEEEVADGASAELASIRKRMKMLEGKIREILSDMIRSPRYTKYLQDPIVTMRGDRYVLPVKSEYKTNVPGILHDSSSTGATLFIEPMAVVQANNQLRDLAIAEREEIEKIIAELSAKVAEQEEVICVDFDTLIQFDVLFAKAKFALSYHCSKPQINQENRICIKKGRHPLIDGQKVVPIDIAMGTDFETLIITGPNTGGKTVTLKTVGLFALMAQSGMQLPCADGSDMPVFEHVFADIGDEQSIEQSLSTFSSHMVNIVDILSKVTDRSLVLFDELGAGTDPEEGAALAVEILEYVRGFRALTIATTHYSELKLYALSTDRVENASCEFDVESLQPTYRLLIGVPGKSNAFAISKRLGLFDHIIEGASRRLSSESVQFEDVIGELQSKRESANQALYEALKMKEEAERKLEEARRQNQKLQEKKQEITRRAQQQAREIVERAKEETAALLKEAQKLAAEAQSKDQLRKMEEVRQQLRETGGKLDKALTRREAAPGQPPKHLKLGNTVRVLSMGEEGSVLTLPGSNGDLFVQMGIMKVKVNIRDVRLVKDNAHKEKGERVIASRKSFGKSAHISTELDVRGQLCDEAVANVDKFIDDAVLASLPKISVIHGKGTGALRSAIHDYLKGNRLVKRFRLGAYGEGDTGVTIIELK